jgi:hypothetical protein
MLGAGGARQVQLGSKILLVRKATKVPLNLAVNRKFCLVLSSTGGAKISVFVRKVQIREATNIRNSEPVPRSGLS